MNTTPQAKHTPGKLKAQSRCLSDGSLVLKDEAFNEICCVRPREEREYGPQDDLDQANASRLAHCWNNHDALLEALQAAHAALLRLSDDDIEQIEAMPAIVAASTAIQAATSNSWYSDANQVLCLAFKRG